MLQTASPGPAAAAGSALPNHFAIGMSASPVDIGASGWTTSTGIPFDYVYQYLSGGVNTNVGWETWNSNGQFPLYYAQSAQSHGFTPVLTYYELLQSSGPCSTCSESQKDRAHLADASTMASYYRNFALLMKRLGQGTYDGINGFGATAVVHVEPDLSGNVHQAAAGDDPSTVAASVAASGVAEVAAYPNTYQGFNWALLHLRDLYAPNVKLAFHISPWGSGTDIGTSTDPNLNVATLGTRQGTFAAKSGVTQAPGGTTTYDLIFNDVADRDAGYSKYVFGDPSRWWDRLNVTFPNFHRWEQWISAIVSSAGNKPVMVWQVPLGNQYFQTENNTNGHYQDNRIEYIFGHITELSQAGIVGALFGAGNAGSTVPSDATNDGITNPPSFCTSDGMSSGQACNNHASTVADDDGGYLRTQAKAYLANPNPPGGPVQLLTQPARLVDTRSNGGALQPGSDRCYAVAGQAGVPGDAAGAILNVTAVGQTSRGWFTLYPAGQPVPNTSTLNFDSTEWAIANGAIVRLGSGGQVCLDAGQAAAQLIIDIAGYIPSAGAAALPMLASPARLVDTRSGTGGQVTPGTDRCFMLAGQAGIPADAAGVAVNVTAVGYPGVGWLTLYPGGQPRPTTSTVNFDPREYAIANNGVVKLGNGQVCISAGQVASHAIVDVVGYLTAQGVAQLPLSQPQRLVDTRTAGGAVAPGSDRCFAVAGQGGIPSNASGVIVNVTTVGYAGRGWLSLYPDGQTVPNTSTLNFDTTEAAIANGTFARLGTGGQVCVDIGMNATQVILDATGYVP